MLKRLNRITKKKEIDNVFKNGRSCYSKILGIKTLANGLDYNRFVFIVSNKVSKKAVDRNKIKRQIRAICRQNNNKILNSNDFLIITLPPIMDKKYQEIAEEIIKNLKKLRLYK